MAGKKKLFHLFTFVVLLGVLLAADATKKNHSKNKVHLAAQKNNEFLFADNDDQQMLRDEPYNYESSGDGDSSDVAGTNPESPVEELIPDLGAPENPVDETETLENLGENSAGPNENDLFIDDNIDSNLSLDDLMKEEIDLDWIPPRPFEPNSRPVKPPTRPAPPLPIVKPNRPVRPPVQSPPVNPPTWPEELTPIQPIRPPCQAANRRCRSGSRRCHAAKRRCQLTSKLPPLPDYRPPPAAFSPTNL